MTETEFTDEILRWAKVYGWRRFHVRGDTRRLIQGDVGFPDLVLVKPTRLIFAELKVGKNRVTPEQRQWIMDLNENAEAYEWRPEQWSEILAILSK